MAVIRAGPCTPAAPAASLTGRLAAVSSASPAISLDRASCPWQGSLSLAAADSREAAGQEWPGSFGMSRSVRRRQQELLIVSRAGGSRPPPGARKPRITVPRRFQQEDPPSKDGVLVNGEIRAPVVRLLDEKQAMVGVVPLQEAMQRSKEAELDLVMISPDADPPVVRIVDYSKFRYEQQKKKKDQQRKSLANRVEVKELKMRYNIDKHDYDVRLRAAQRFLRGGDKVKVIVTFKGREFEFKDLASELFERFQQDTAEIGIVEMKMQLEGKSLSMVLAPNKLAILKASAKQNSKSKMDENDSGDEEEGGDGVYEDDVDDEDEDAESHEKVGEVQEEKEVVVTS